MEQNFSHVRKDAYIYIRTLYIQPKGVLHGFHGFLNDHNLFCPAVQFNIIHKTTKFMISQNFPSPLKILSYIRT